MIFPGRWTYPCAGWPCPCGIVWSCCTRWRNPGLIRLRIYPITARYFVAYTFPIISHFPGLNYPIEKITPRSDPTSPAPLRTSFYAGLPWSPAEDWQRTSRRIVTHAVAIGFHWPGRKKYQYSPASHIIYPFSFTISWELKMIWLWINTYTICRGMNMDLPTILTLENNRLWFWPIPIYQ